MPNNDYLGESNLENEETTRLARFKTTRAIRNAQMQAKVTDGSFKSRTIVCRGLTSPSATLFNKDDKAQN